MLFCPICRVEYRSGFTNCADCGEQLVEKVTGKCAICGNDFSKMSDDDIICDECHNKIVLKRAEKDRQNNDSQDYTAPSVSLQPATTSGWIKGMRIFAWIAFIAIIIGGIVMSVPFWGNSEPLQGLVIMVAGFVSAFLSVALIMIFLDMAEDIKAIRNNTRKKDE
jgi:DNA-directed RNA polymerase subunit RPC12/RpoP